MILDAAGRPPNPSCPTRAETHRSFSNAFVVSGGMAPPFQRVGHLAGPMALAIATGHGVVASTPTHIGLHSYDLAEQLWRVPMPGVQRFVHFDDKVFVGPVQDCIVIIDVASGEVTARLPCTDGEITAVTAHGALVSSNESLTMVDVASGRRSWSVPCEAPYVACDQTSAYLRVGLHDELACVDLSSGARLWQFKAESEGIGRAARDSQEVHDYGAVMDAVIVVTRSGRVYKLDRRTGRPEVVATTPIRGIPLLAESSLFLFGRDVLLEFQLADMKAGMQTDLTRARASGAVASYAVSEQAVVWTTMNGAVWAISRRDPRVSWQDDLSPVVFSTAQPPIIWDDFLYVEPKGGDVALIAYRSATA
jgi:hypothetical protein